jgi:hypothetical protein
MSLYQHKNSQNKITKLTGKIFTPVIATFLIAVVGVSSYFSFSLLQNFGVKVAQAACPAGFYANPGGNTFGADPYGGEDCLPNPDLTAAQLANTVVSCQATAGGSAIINTSANTCRFSLPPNTKLPTTFKIGIGGATPAVTCSANTTGLVTCTNVPAGSTINTNTPVTGQIGTTTSPFINGVVTVGGGTIINPATNIGASATAPCNNTGGSVSIGTSISCVFPLTGSPDNTYTLPNGGLQANVATATGTASCGIFNNGTTAASLVCVDIPTTGATAGVQNIQVGGQNKGSVTLENAQAGCTVAKPCFLQTTKYEFNPKSSSTNIAKGDQDLTIKPGIFTTAAAAGNKYVCRISLKKEGAEDANNTLGYAAQTTKLINVNGSTIPTGGSGVDTYKQLDYTANGCSFRLPLSAQMDVKWYYRIIVGEVNSSEVFVDGGINRAEPSYFFLYGAALSLNSNVTPLP